MAQINGSTTTQFLIDPIGMASVAAEFDGSGSMVSHFTYGLGLASSVPALGSAEFYQFDGSANTAVMSGAGGAVLNAYSYLPFGEKVQSTVTVPNPFTYAGQAGITDDGNGLYYMRARYYDPTLGRFLAEDPSGFQGGINLYGYVKNDPLDQTDPLGLDSDSPFCRRLREKIDNVRQNIQRRLGQLDENPGKLPETCPGDKAKPSLSRAGHRALINMDKALLSALEGYYAAYCQGGPPSPPTPVPAPTPEQQRQVGQTLTLGAVGAGGIYVIGEYGWILAF